MADVRDPNRDQPLPTAGRTSVQDALIAAIAERRDYGSRKYGRPLETHNGRDALTDAWEESLDLATYLTQVRMERDDHVAFIKRVTAVRDEWKDHCLHPQTRDLLDQLIAAMEVR